MAGGGDTGQERGPWGLVGPGLTSVLATSWQPVCVSRPLLRRQVSQEAWGELMR